MSVSSGGDSLDLPPFSYEGPGDSLDSLVLRESLVVRQGEGGKGMLILLSFRVLQKRHHGSSLVDCSSLYT